MSVVDGYSIMGVLLTTGEYLLSILPGGVLGEEVPFTVTYDDVANKSKEVSVTLTENLWQFNVDTPSDWTIETNPNAEIGASTVKVSYYSENYSQEKCRLKPTLSDGQMISFRTQYHGAFKNKLAHGINVGNNSYFTNLTMTSGNCDMYVKHTVGGVYMGLTSKGDNWGGTKVKASPFGSLTAPFQLLQDYSLTYDLAYVRLDNTVYMLGKYGTDTEWVVISTIVVSSGPASVILHTGMVSGYAHNYTYSNFVYKTDANKVRDFYDTNKDNVAKPNYGYDETTQTYSASIVGNGLSFTDVTGDKTKGTFTIEGTITTAGGAYAGVGFAVVDPNTGRFVNFTTNTHTGKWSVSTRNGNGYNGRVNLEQNLENGVIGLRDAGDDIINISNVTDSVTFKLKAVIRNNVWEVYVSESASNLDNLVKVAIIDMEQLIKKGNYADSSNNTVAKRNEIWNTYYPTANVVSAGFYSFSDGSRITKYSNVKITYKPYCGYDETTQTYSASIVGNGLSFTDVTGDKTKGTFTIEGTITTAGGNYAGIGFAIADPTTGRFVYVGANGSTKNFLISTQDGNGWGRRMYVNEAQPAGSYTFAAQEVMDNVTAINLNNLSAPATFKMKAVITNNVWKISVSKSATELDTLVELVTIDMEKLIKEGNYANGDMNNETSRLENWNSFYPTANVVNVGFYSFSDGSRYTEYTNVKISYVADAQ